jgi:hypothetical protein
MEKKSEPVKPPELSMLWGDFTIFDSGDKWIIKCNKCRKRWSLPKGPVHAGNVLSLMNHVDTH